LANSLNILNNVFYIIIAVIALVAIIFILIQWRRVRNSKSQIKYLEKQAEHKEIELVEKDLEPKNIIIGLPETFQEQLSPIRNNTGKMLRKVGFLQTKLNKRISRMEPSKDYKKLQKLLKEIEMKEKKIEKRARNN
jgi:RNase H-fold protein (predicted Holliday junction resolvase)